VKRHYLGRAGKVANGIASLPYVRSGTGHVLAGARQWMIRSPGGPEAPQWPPLLHLR